MKFDLLMLSLVSALMIIFFNPIIMGCCLFFMSLVLIKSIGMISSVWFAYLMFMVYIGGMLVLFIYICMITSNFKFSMSFSLLGIMITMFFFIYILFFNFSLPEKILMCSFQSMSNFPLFMMFILIFFLLVIFFSIVHIIFNKNISMKNEL